MCRTVCPQNYECAELCVLRIIDVQNLCVLSTQNYRCQELCVLRIMGVQNCVCSELWSVQGFIQVLCFCVRFYFSNVWLDVHGFNTNLKEMRMGFIKPGPKFLRWIHVRQRQC
jgi:hypothetical protein